MLNLEPLFQDASTALELGGAIASVSALPATVYLMQRDVLNAYRYALDHYLIVELDAPFLQKSSLGSPYEKWAKFTNDDFAAVSFAATDLLRYTARLVHDTQAACQHADGQYSESKRSGSRYIAVLVEVPSSACSAKKTSAWSSGP